MEFYGKALIMILAGAFAIFVFFSAITSEQNQKLIEKRCEVSCKVRKSMLIFGGCHCMTDTGWEKAD